MTYMYLKEVCMCLFCMSECCEGQLNVPQNMKIKKGGGKQLKLHGHVKNWDHDRIRNREEQTNDIYVGNSHKVVM